VIAAGRRREAAHRPAQGRLGRRGFAVDVAHDGSEGLWLATENTYDVIVLDVMLPRLNGYRVCARIREAENWTPVLMLTAKDGEYDEAEALDTGARSGTPGGGSRSG
jgi:DNA-binding response OmpR family regulator